MSYSLQEHAEELQTNGYTVVEGVLTPSEVDTANAALEEIFARELEIAPQRGWLNDVYHVAYMLPQKHPFFRSFCENPRVLPLMQALLGTDCVVGSLNGLSMTPGGKTQDPHIDQDETVPGRVLTINALHTLDDFTRANGCTRVLPGSQNRELTRDLDRAAIEAQAVYLEAPAGSLIAFNGGLWHAGSANTTGRPRRALHAFYHKPWIRPQWDYPRSLTPGVVATLTDRQKQLFGFNARPPWYDAATDQVRRN